MASVRAVGTWELWSGVKMSIDHCSIIVDCVTVSVIVIDPVRSGSMTVDYVTVGLMIRATEERANIVCRL